MNSNTIDFQIKKKPLLIFAHRGEGQTFILQDSLVALPDNSPLKGHIFEGPLYFLLLTGEGVQAATEKTTIALTKLRDLLNGVVNFGIAGSLSPACKNETGFWIRTVYHQLTDGVEFKSFTSEFGARLNRVTDCISFTKRLLDHPTENFQAEIVANLVDRELWGTASVCNLFKLPFAAYKLVSDEVGRDTFSLCQTTKSKAQHFSERLYEEWTHCKENFIFETSIFGREEKITTSVQALFENSSFHFTFSMKQAFMNQFQKLLNRGESETKIFQILEVEPIQKLPLRPKDRTHILLTNLAKNINPFEFMIEQKTVDLLSTLHSNGIHTYYEHETGALQCRFLLHSDSEKQKILELLQNFSLIPLHNLSSGNFGAELKPASKGPSNNDYNNLA